MPLALPRQAEYDLKEHIIKEVQNVGEIYRTYDDEAQTLTRPDAARL